MFVFTWFLIPETKGISLEKMDELFGAVPTKDVDMERNSEDRSPPAEMNEKGEVNVSHIEKR